MKTAFVHDWLAAPGGSERVLESLYSIWPSPVYTLICDGSTWDRKFGGKANLFTSFLQRLPGVLFYYRQLLPVFPMAVETFNLSSYDVVISSSHCVAKGCLTRSDQLHISYCHTPMRYAWDLTHEYLVSMGLFKRVLAKISLHYLRFWDQSSAQRVDAFVANSHHTARRIRKAYGRTAQVIYPPVDVERFRPVGRGAKGDYFVTVARLVPYKRVELVIAAFNKLGLPLKVVGDGPLEKSLRALAGPTVELVGALESSALEDMVARARGFVFAAEEDFGIAPVEAQAAGTPVIAYGRGGVAETVVDGETGVFFHEQTVDAIVDAVRRFQAVEGRFDAERLRANASRFSRARFEKEFKYFVEKQWTQFQGEALMSRAGPTPDSLALR